MGIGATPKVNGLSFVLNSYQIRLFNTVKAEIFGKIKINHINNIFIKVFKRSRKTFYKKFSEKKIKI